MSCGQTNWTTFIVGAVDVDKAFSPWGRVRLYIPGLSKDRWWHYFKSEKEWLEFYQLWAVLEKPFKLQLREYPKSNRWRAVPEDGKALRSYRVGHVVTRIEPAATQLPPGNYSAECKFKAIDCDTVEVTLTNVKPL